jgi:hypothetical protein
MDELSLSEDDLAQQIGLSDQPSLLLDIALYDDELTSTLTASVATRVASILGLSVWQVLAIQCPRCCGHRLRRVDGTGLHVARMINEAAHTRGLSRSELAKRIGYDEVIFAEAESGTQPIDAAISLEECRTLSNEVGIPLATILGLSCDDCDSAIDTSA